MAGPPEPRSSIEPDEGEHLATGWEPDLPDSDTLVRRAVAVHASWGVAVADSLGRPSRRTPRWAGGFVGDKGALTNPVVVTAPLAPGEYAEVLGEVGGLVPDRAPYFLVSPFPTPDLSAHGLVRIGHPPLMVRFPGGAAPPLRDGVGLRQVADEDTLAVAERVLVEGYPMPELQPLVPGSILAPPLLDGTTRVWLAYVDGQPSAVAAAHVAGGAVLVEYVAALPSGRGRGAGAAATWAATLCEPDLPAVLVASDDGRPLYETMGFVAVERWTAWLRPAR
ncbi:hypothetical protein [Nocardioides marmoribigeumensis]|uniref:N-acetyltransferase domain-containing protein n=1 Tax=Nocardioides marmoribigeumensis TaxID=433649 RepID=A0ABU2C1K5_9ACTN|nr:hypothetical protein [Nocardioides marmoribigeumensis]MDR7364464.1 hypothetical protein [Nocardioides marmoribigeumensis]